MANTLQCVWIFALYFIGFLPPSTIAVDVLILGAGATGISAGKYLQEHGVTDFIILEGSNRIGGRVKDVQFGGKTVEVGANWIQPGKASVNPIVDLAADLGIKGKASDWESVIFRGETGDDLSEEAGLFYPAFERALKYSDELADDLISNKLPDMSMRSALRLGGWNPTSNVQKAIEYYDFDFEYAAIPYVTSLKSTAVVDNSEAIFVTDQRGFTTVITSLADDFLTANDSRLLLETVVTKVQYDSDGVTVTCKDKSTYTAKFAIITFSIGVLQSDAVEFDPPLPDWKIEEIFQFDMTLYTKIFMKFPDGTPKFWDSEEFILYASSRRGYYTVWQNFEADGLFEAGTNLLMATVTGDESRRVEFESDEQIKTELMEILRQVYGNGIPDVEEIMLNRWSQDPLFRGAYSNWPVEVSAECHLRLQANIGRLYFGGEATDPEWNGYIQGGMFSGEREAEKVLKCMDGVCEQYTPKVMKRGCTYSMADNYDENATVDSGECRFAFASVSGSDETSRTSIFSFCIIYMMYTLYLVNK